MVLPSEMDALRIEPGEDYCTLLTCTPYGINSHRLLVRGRRVPTPVQEDETPPGAAQVAPDQDEGHRFDPVPVLAAAVLIAAALVAAPLPRGRVKQLKKIEGPGKEFPEP